jgi:serine protease Do
MLSEIRIINLPSNTKSNILFGFITLIIMLFHTALYAHPTNSLADIVDKITPAVVNIATTPKLEKKKYYGPETLKEFLERQFTVPEVKSALGSGFIIDPKGYIVTNYHVIEGADEVNVTLNNEKTYKAKVIGQDPKTDIALLKIDNDNELPFLEFDDSDQVRVGDIVIAVGNPFGLGGTVTSGIVSATSRHINAESSFSDYIQTDASINRGNSGGPLCNSVNGKVIGVNASIFSTSGGSIGIGFAVPSLVVKEVVEELKTKGKIERGWLGIAIQPIDEKLAKGMKLENEKGALVTSVTKDSPAEKAGIAVGDIILKFNNIEIDNMKKLPRIVATTEIGSKVDIMLLRNGVKNNLTIIVEKLPNQDMNINENNGNILGLNVTTITPELQQRYNINDNNGVVVTDIEKDSIFLVLGIRPGDVILKVNNIDINSPQDLEKALMPKGNIALLVSRKGKNHFIGIELK